MLCSFAQACPTFWDPMDCSPADSSVQGIFPARILVWVDLFSSRGSSQPRESNPGLLHWQVDSKWLSRQGSLIVNEMQNLRLWFWSNSNLNYGVHYFSKSSKNFYKVKVARLCPTLCNPMDSILQARILKWAAFPFSRGSSQPRERTQVSCIAGGFFTSWVTKEAQEYWIRRIILSHHQAIKWGFKNPFSELNVTDTLLFSG